MHLKVYDDNTSFVPPQLCRHCEKIIPITTVTCSVPAKGPDSKTFRPIARVASNAFTRVCEAHNGPKPLCADKAPRIIGSPGAPHQKRSDFPRVSNPQENVGAGIKHRLGCSLCRPPMILLAAKPGNKPFGITVAGNGGNCCRTYARLPWVRPESAGQRLGYACEGTQRLQLMMDIHKVGRPQL